MVANLSQLSHDLLVAIAKRLKKLEDFVSFRCVSKSLCTSAREEYFEGLPYRQRLPYLILPVRDDGDEDVRELYSLVEGESIVSSVKVPNLKTKMCFESLGWLLVVDKDGSMSLLDPFSGTEILVPHQRTCPGFGDMDEHIMIQKMVLSARPSETSDFVLMVISGGLGHLAFWRLGDKAWNTIETRRARFADVVYGGTTNIFYAIGYPGFVWALNLADYGNKEEARVITPCKHVVPANPSSNLYILKTTDHALLFITRTAPDLCEGNLCYMTEFFEVYEVDMEKCKYKEIDSLGNMAV